jgi:serine/threonine protein kinase
LLIGANGEIRMSDFGWSVISTDAQSRTTLCGTADYLAPEMLNRSGHGTTADIWCLGVLCYELLYGKPPFEEESLSSTCARIRKADFNFPEHRKVRMPHV